MTYPQPTAAATDHAASAAMPVAAGTRRRARRRPVRALVLMLAVATALGGAASDNAPGTPFTGQAAIMLAADPIVFQSASVTYLHHQTWTADLRPARTVLTTYDEQIWWHPDGTALTKHCARSEPPGRNRIAHPEPETRPCPQTTRYGVGGFTTAIIEPLGTDQETMRRQLARYQTGSGDQYVLRAVATLYRYHHLNPQQRAAVLMVLAGLPSAMYRGETTDRGGRKGLAFSVDSGHDSSGRTRDLIVLDGGTGVLLNYEQIAVTAPPGKHVKPMSITAYVVYLDSRMTTTIPGTPSTTCDQNRCTAGPHTKSTTPPSSHHAVQESWRLAAHGAVALMNLAGAAHEARL